MPVSLPHTFAGISGSAPMQYLDDNFAAMNAAIPSGGFAASGANNDITALNALSSVPTVVASAIAAAPLIRAIGPAGYSATATIALSDFNRPLMSFPSGPITLTIPTGTAAGQSVTVTNMSTTVGAFVTLATTGTQRIYAQGLQNQTSIVLGLGDSITLEFDGSISWQQVSGAAQFGIGQTLTNVMASRVAGATYTNSTGKAIWVTVSMYSATTPTSFNLNVGPSGAQVACAWGFSATGYTSTASAPVGPNETYSTSGSTNITAWFERR